MGCGGLLEPLELAFCKRAQELPEDPRKPGGAPGGPTRPKETRGGSSKPREAGAVRRALSRLPQAMPCARLWAFDVSNHAVCVVFGLASARFSRNTLMMGRSGLSLFF